MPSTDYSTAQLARTPPKTPQDRVPFLQKVGYGCGTFVDMWGHWLYPNIAFQIFSLYLGVSPTLVGIALILNRVFDGIYDPVFGWLSDNTRSRIGRRRPYLLVGSLLAGAGLPFLVAVAPGWGTTQIGNYAIPHYFWFMIISSALYLPLVSCFNMPYVSLGNELTPDYNERTMVFTVKNAVQKLPELGLFFAGSFYTLNAWSSTVQGSIIDRLKYLFTSADAWKAAAKGTENQLLGAQVFLVFAGIVIVVAGLITFSLVRERYYDKLIATRKQEKVSLSETLWQTLKCKPFRIQIVMQLGYNMGTSMVGTLGFALTAYYVCGGDLPVANRWNSIMGIFGMIMGFLGLPVFAFIAHVRDKRIAMMTVMVAAIAAFISSWWFYTPHVVWLQVFAAGCIAFTGAGFWMLIYSLGADVVDYDELETGRRREGAFAACSSWINKFGMAIGAGFSLVILDWIGFKSTPGSVQTEHTLFMMRFLFLAIPSVGLVLAFLALIFFPLSATRMSEIRTQLEARRGKV